MLDLYIYPNDIETSAWYSLLIGAVTVVGAFASQIFGPSPFQHGSILHSIALRVIILLYAIAGISFWRGIWYLQDVYLVPAQPELSSWLSFAIGTCVLLLLNSLRSTHAPPFFTVADSLDTMSWQVTSWYQEQGRTGASQKETRDSYKATEDAYTETVV